jgi:hypothetical protein
VVWKGAGGRLLPQAAVHRAFISIQPTGSLPILKLLPGTCSPPPAVCSKGEWSEVEIPLSRFLLTWRGKVVEEVVELNAKRITTLGISLAGGDQLQPQVHEGGGLQQPQLRVLLLGSWGAAACSPAGAAQALLHHPARRGLNLLRFTCCGCLPGAPTPKQRCRGTTSWDSTGLPPATREYTCQRRRSAGKSEAPACSGGSHALGTSPAALRRCCGC